MNPMLSQDQILQRFLDAMCIDIQRYIGSYLQLSELRKYCIYTKYSNYQKCIDSMNVFTTSEINQYFHADDLFGMSRIKDIAIKDYLQFNLMNRYFPLTHNINQRYNNTDQWYIIKRSWYENIRKIIICSKYRTLRNTHI